MKDSRHRRTGQNRLLRLLDGLERQSRADSVIDLVSRGVRALPLGAGRDLLHGKWLGYPVQICCTASGWAIRCIR